MSHSSYINAQRHDRTALIMYGSETGTAQDVAEELDRLARRLHFTTRLCDLDSVSLNDLPRFDVVLCAISTTGQGELPDNSRNFWLRLRNSRLSPGCLEKVRFASFGLGDSSYPKYNWAHRKLHSRLRKLGAWEVCDRGESDEQHPEGVDGQFIPWAIKLRESLLDQIPLPIGIRPIPEDEFLTPDWILQLDDARTMTNGSNHSPQVQDEWSSSSWDTLTPVKGGLTTTLAVNKRVTADDHWQDVRLLEFSTPGLTYSPGDVLSIFPKNFSEDVEHLISLMEWGPVADLPLVYVRSNSPAGHEASDNSEFPHLAAARLITLRTLLANHLDITAIPRRSFFASIAHFTNDEMQKERLIEFNKPEFIDEFYDYTTRPRRSILEVLQEFDTVKIPLKWVVSVIPTIRDRQFSIASGGTLKADADGQGRVELLVAIVKYRTVIKKIRQGLCTRYLAALQPGARLNVVHRKGGIKVCLDQPALLIGPGTGIAPLRSIIYEQCALALSKDTPLPNQALFFGCRKPEADFYFKDEWAGMKEVRIFPAFSRDQTSKTYVQHLIRQQSSYVYQLLERGAIIYLSGSSGEMPKAVREALVTVYEKEGGVERSRAEAQLEKLEKSGRYQQETW